MKQTVSILQIWKTPSMHTVGDHISVQ